MVVLFLERHEDDAGILIDDGVHCTNAAMM